MPILLTASISAPLILLFVFCTGYEAHKQACERWSNFVAIMRGRQLRVEDQINQAVSQTVLTNRQVLKSIFDAVVTLGRQGLAFRGHRDNEADRVDPKNNSGNFYAMLCLRARGMCLLYRIKATCLKSVIYHIIWQLM